MKFATDYDLPSDIMPGITNLARYIPLNNTKAYTTYDLTHSINFNVNTLKPYMYYTKYINAANKTIMHVSNEEYDSIDYAWILGKINNIYNLFDILEQGSYVICLHKQYLDEIIQIL